MSDSLRDLLLAVWLLLLFGTFLYHALLVF